MKSYLNLGCGDHYHSSWTNIDINESEFVIGFNLLHGIPFSDESMEVIYHSHLLEHFTKSDGFKFLNECYRVLKPGGIIRIAVPDLESIAKLYLKYLELANSGDINAVYNYDWIMLEMYDQTVRNNSGGEMYKYLSKGSIHNEDFIVSRMGRVYQEIQNQIKYTPDSISGEPEKKRIFFLNKKLTTRYWKSKILRKIFHVNLNSLNIGEFRTAGEIHQWMYDRYSLRKILIELGFKNIQIQNAFSSKIPNWENFNLDGENETIFKPDSLFMEATK